MTSDSIVHTYRSWTRFGLPNIVGRIDVERLTAFARLSSTMGGTMLFPSWTGTRHVSINQARGMLTNIADRIDLTLECIRRHYADAESPMTKTLAWYADYFALFRDLQGFVEFFMLEDLMTTDLSAVRFHLPFDDFERRVAAPADVDEYERYMASSMRFVAARNRRIDLWASEHLA